MLHNDSLKYKHNTKNVRQMLVWWSLLANFLVYTHVWLLHAFLFIRMVFFRFNMDILNFWANIILFLAYS